MKIKLKEKIGKIKGKIRRKLQIDVDAGIETGCEWTEWQPIPKWVLKVYIKAHRHLKEDKNKDEGQTKSEIESDCNSHEST
jgi:hypothetical protein